MESVFSAADLINRQLTMAECAACQPPLWLGGSPPFCGLGALCPPLPPLFPPPLCVYISLGEGGGEGGWGEKTRRGEEKCFKKKKKQGGSVVCLTG